MFILRAGDTAAIHMTKRGIFSFYHSIRGKEATYCGAAFGLEPGDWMFFGPQVPQGGFLMVPTPHSLVVPTYPSPTAARLVHATGVGMAIAVKKDSRVVCVVFGEGLSDSADFHAAVNFAAVYNTPVIFLAVVTSKQHDELPAHLSHTSEAYGVPMIEVDGSDAISVMKVVSSAAQEIRRHHGPRMVVARIDAEMPPDLIFERIQQATQPLHERTRISHEVGTASSDWPAPSREPDGLRGLQGTAMPADEKSERDGHNVQSETIEPEALGWEWARRCLIPTAAKPVSAKTIESDTQIN